MSTTTGKSRTVKSSESCDVDQVFIDDSDRLVERVGKYIDLNDATICLTGPPGTGKTTLLESLAAQRGRKLLTAIASDLLPSDLVGSFRLRSANTVFVPGLLCRAVKHGHWFYLDEVLAADSAVLNVLHSLIDHRRSLFIPIINRTLKAHPDFRLVLSYNPVKNGVDLPRPFRDRLIIIPIERLDQKTEQRFLTKRFQITKAQAEFITNYGAYTREVTPHSGASLRQLQQAAKAVSQGVSLLQAAEECILNGVAGCDATLRQDIVNRVLASGLTTSEELSTRK
jgi:nitric oxide reductase NorQ protein